MGVVDGCAHGLEQAQALSDSQLQGFAVAVDALPVHVLQNEIRNAVVPSSGIEQPADVGMIESSQDLAFTAETAEDIVVVESGLDYFDGHGRALGFALVEPR